MTAFKIDAMTSLRIAPRASCQPTMSIWPIRSVSYKLLANQLIAGTFLLSFAMTLDCVTCQPCVFGQSDDFLEKNDSLGSNYYLRALFPSILSLSSLSLWSISMLCSPYGEVLQVFSSQLDNFHNSTPDTKQFNCCWRCWPAYCIDRNSV